MIKFVDESGTINYCLCTALVRFTVMHSFLVKSYVYTFLVKKYVAHNVHQLLFRTKVFVLTNSVCPMSVTWMPTEFVIKQLFACSSLLFNLGPRAVIMLQAPRYLNPSLLSTWEFPVR